MIFDIPSEFSDSEVEIIPPLSDALLTELFTAASTVGNLKPWTRLGDTDWIGLKDPDTGQIHIIAVMGAGKQLYSIQVYLPEEGIHFWNEFIRTYEPDVTLGKFNMRMVSCEFVSWNEDDMDDTDIARNQQFGTLDLANQTLDSALFRAIHPGQVNWHPTEDEALKLLDALRIIPRFLKEFTKLPQKCYDNDWRTAIPWIPAYHLKDDGTREDPTHWERKIIPFPQATLDQSILPDALFPERLAKFSVKKNEVWEIGSTYFEKAMIVQGTPTWLVFTVVAAQSNGMALGAELIPCTQPREIMLRKSLLKAASEAGHLPGTLEVQSDLAQETFRDPPRINISRKDTLPFIDEITEHFLAHQGLSDPSHPLAGLSPETADKLQEILANAPSPDECTPEILQNLMAQVSQIDGGEQIMKAFFEATSGEGNLPLTLDECAMMEMDLFGMEDEEDQEEPPLRQITDTGERFIFRIDLEGSKPPIWRRLRISSGATFADLHHAIQDLFDWENCHLYSFQKRQGRRLVQSIGPDPEHDDLPDSRTLLKDFFKRKGTKLTYLYDFGDDWSHLITLEEKKKAQPEEASPACLAGRGLAPPEDCGGIWGFYELLDPDSGLAEDYGWEKEDLDIFREGKFHPASVVFR